MPRAEIEVERVARRHLSDRQCRAEVIHAVHEQPTEVNVLKQNCIGIPCGVGADFQDCDIMAGRQLDLDSARCGSVEPCDGENCIFQRGATKGDPQAERRVRQDRCACASIHGPRRQFRARY